MRLADICEINPKADSINDEMAVSFVAMQDVSEDGKINTATVRPYQEAKKGFTCFREGDVLFAKITPCMENGKGALAVGLENGIGCGSTEFHVLRPKTDIVVGAWLYYLTAWPVFRAEAEKNMTGSAGQKRVPKIFLEKYEVKIPTLDTQKRQVGLLNCMRDIIDLRKKQLTELDNLIKARFVEMFGDCNKLTSIKQSGLTISDGNYSSKYPRSEEFVDSGIPFIRANNIKDGTICDEDMYYITGDKHKVLKKGHLKTDDILITTRGNIGQVAIVPSRHNDSNINAQIVLLRDTIGRFCPQYLLEALQTAEVKRQYNELQTGTALKQLPVSRLEDVNIIEPPVSLQLQFAAFSDQINRSKKTVMKALDEVQTLFDSLMQQFFG